MTSSWKVSAFTPAGRLLAACTLFFFIGVHVFALVLVRTVTEAAGSAQAHFAYRDLTYLLRMSHQHLFGHGAMYFVTGGLFLATPFPEKVKAFAVPLPFLGAALDLASWWLLKYSSVNCELLSVLGGSLLTFSFLGMALATLWSLTFPPKP